MILRNADLELSELLVLLARHELIILENLQTVVDDQALRDSVLFYICLPNFDQ